MAGSARPDSQGAGSIDGSTFPNVFPNGQRGLYQGSGLDRSGSFRENSDSRGRVSGPTTSRSNASSPAEITSISQCLPTDVLSLGEQKYGRCTELRMILNVSNDDHAINSAQCKALPPIVMEELKRFRASIVESSDKARDRSKILGESIQKVDKYRSTVTKKRNDFNEKFGGTSSLKITQPHQNSAEPLVQRSEDKMKNMVTNKRARSSMAELEGRSSNLSRPLGIVDREKNVFLDKDKNVVKACSEVSTVSEEKVRGLNPGGEGWDRKIKRKRTVGSMVNRINDTDRDSKLTIPQRPNIEPRPRVNDNLSFRAGPSGILGTKYDGPSQLINASSRVVKIEADCGSVLNERKERTTGTEKDRVHVKGNKHSIREEGQFGSQGPFKVKARGPRTNSFLNMNSFSNLSRMPGSSDRCEQTTHLKPQPSALLNRKRPSTTESSSPPVTQWGGVRSQKMQRARRVNVVSPVSNFEEAHVLPEGFPTPSSSLHSKLSKDHDSSPTGPSESEESGATVNRLKEKVTDGDADGAMETGHNVMTSMKKSKISLKDEIGDVVRRQGRSGRGPAHVRSVSPLVKEKTDLNMKLLKGGRTGSEKIESRLGRPPCKKGHDRRGIARPMHVMNSASPDLTGESDDDREELLAVATATRSASYDACVNSFWKRMEPIFSPICAEDMDFVKNQIDILDELDKSVNDVVELDFKKTDDLLSDFPSSNSTISSQHSRMNGINRNQSLEDADLSRSISENVGSEKWFGEIIPLCQRLLSAFIAEDGNELYDYKNEEGDSFCDFFPYTGNSQMQDMNYFVKDGGCNGFLMSKDNSSDILQGSNPAVHSRNGLASQVISISSNHLQSRASVASPYECQYEHLPLNERILMELHSIGLCPDIALRPELDEEGEIGGVITELKMRLQHQVEIKRAQLKKLETALKDLKLSEERNLEQLAMDKLIEKAYRRLLGGRSHKNSASKISKQHAMAFVKRALIKCQKFEESGRSKSCFSEPPFRDILFAPRHRSDAQYYDVVLHGLGENPGGSHNKLNRVSRDIYDGQTHMTSDVIPNRSKKKEVLLEDVVTSAVTRAGFPFGAILPGGPKLKRSDRDRHQNKESKGSNTKSGRSSSSGRGDRKTKSKPKQKMAHLSNSSECLVRALEVSSSGAPTRPEPHEASTVSSNRLGQCGPGQSSAFGVSDSSKEAEGALFTNLPFSEADPIVDLDVQAQDIDSWLSSDMLNDEVLQEQDLVGLQIPMDDLSDLNF